jgi:hypothetical protein
MLAAVLLRLANDVKATARRTMQSVKQGSSASSEASANQSLDASQALETSLVVTIVMKMSNRTLVDKSHTFRDF